MLTDKQAMLKFLEEFSGLHKNIIIVVLFIGEKSTSQGYYNVQYERRCADTRIPMDNFQGSKVCRCLVNKAAFKRYREENPKIIHL